jgi:hypothetical protein
MKARLHIAVLKDQKKRVALIDTPNLRRQLQARLYELIKLTCSPAKKLVIKIVFIN